MLSNRPLAQYALILILALSLTACNSDSDPEVAGISLAITSPTSSSTMDTTDISISLAGTAESETGIAQVSWVNDRGGDGVADGSDSWQIGSIDLALGENNITLTAEDAAGETSSRTLVVNRESGETGSTTLAWNAPTERTDGSPLTNLAGYKIYYGRMSGVYDYQIDIDSPGIASYVVENLVSGDWYFALAAYDTEGLESDRSGEVVREIT